MIKFKKINKDTAPEHLYSLSCQYDIVLEIEGFEKIQSLCTQLAMTEDLKYIINTDSCDHHQFEKFNKADILAMIEDLKQLAGIMKEK